MPFNLVLFCFDCQKCFLQLRDSVRRTLVIASRTGEPPRVRVTFKLDLSCARRWHLLIKAKFAAAYWTPAAAGGFCFDHALVEPLDEDLRKSVLHYSLANSLECFADHLALQLSLW